MDHGPQPWSALRHALRGHELEHPAVSAVESVPPTIENDPGELRRILAAERQQRLAEATRQAAEAGDVQTLQRLLAAQAGKPGNAGG